MTQYIHISGRFPTAINPKHIELVRDNINETAIYMTSGQVHKVYKESMTYAQVLEAIWGTSNANGQ